MNEREGLKRVKEYAFKHCPFMVEVCEEFEYELIETTRGKDGPDIECIWYVHVWIASIQAAYGLFVFEEKSGEVGGVIESDGAQEIFEYHSSQSLPVVRGQYHLDKKNLLEN